MPISHRYAFVVNPAAGHGSARRALTGLREFIESVDPSACVLVPETKADLLARVAELETTADRVIAVGGDGTVHDVVAALAEWTRRPVLGILPLGTGNDLARMLGFGHGLARDLPALFEAGRRPLDIGRVAWWEAGQAEMGQAEAKGHTQTFVNAVGVGFDAKVAERAARMKFLPGSAAAYLAGVIGTLVRWNAPHVRIQTDAGDYEGPLLLVSACNGRSVGGGFLLAPEADLADGYLDLCLVRAVSRRRILTLLPRAFTPTLGEEAEVDLQRIRRLELWTEEPLTMHADGEILSDRLARLRVDVVPDALDVLVCDGRT